MKTFFKILSTLLVLGLSAYFIWSTLGRTPTPIQVKLHLDSSYVLNSDAGKGNVIGINAYMTPEDYITPDHFEQKLKGYLEECKSRAWLNPKSVVIFPEYIGAWLVVEGEKNLYIPSPPLMRPSRVL